MPPRRKPGSSTARSSSIVTQAHQPDRDCDEREAEAEQPADRHACREPPGDRRREERDHAERQEAHPGLQRRQAEHVLQVERQVEEHREHRRGDRERRHLRADERGPPEQRQVDHRHPLARLRDDEQPRAARSAATNRPTITLLVQPCLLPSISAEDQAEQAAGQRDQPDRVEPAVLGVARLAQLRRGEQTAPMPIGMLTRKIQRHESQEVSIPPASGPIATAAPIVAPQIPKAVPRSRRGTPARSARAPSRT